MQVNKLILSLVIFLLSNQVLAGKVYQWRDADGRVFYSDQPPPVMGVKERSIKPNVLGNASKAQQTASQVKESPTIVLWVSAQCEPMCSNAIAILDQRNVPYEVRNADPKNEKSMLALFNDAGTMQVTPPILIIGKEVYKDWNSAVWQGALTKAGYPLGKK
ncbi:DUF4124 domain-containing protein [Chitinibacter bivalviorum]|uniref:DUF4124 domain-containing protein n=1 Tax=Chitinibacter bivalviorum TaxID=2739434 RepID=A0A7H9BI96_9NEIS|nr:DUF4124 domain-containing protein [Chitinibacter bivalviorum]QLG88443.1 DUF4124 domain-containing protein [Chitinibacter bivalviorum]